jgi:hypothetical protein
MKKEVGAGGELLWKKKKSKLENKKCQENKKCPEPFCFLSIIKTELASWSSFTTFERRHPMHAPGSGKPHPQQNGRSNNGQASPFLLPTGTIAPSAAEDGPSNPTLITADGALGNIQTFDWSVNPLKLVLSIDGQSAIEGDTGSLQVNDSKSGVTVNMTYSATLPAGVTINHALGTTSAGSKQNGDSVHDAGRDDGQENGDEQTDPFIVPIKP